MAAIVREIELNSRIAFQATGGAGDRFAVVLDFNLISRVAPPSNQ
jgi:hypothetical protein